MENSGTQTVATFTGTLLKRRRAPGQPFAQLVFREANQDWLCLTSNLQHAARLQIGKKYQIEGLFKSLGDHDYIHEPDIMPLARQIRKRRIWISLAIGLVILLTAGGIVLAATHGTTPPKQSSDTNATQQIPVNDTSNTSDRPPTDTTDTTTTDTPATTPVTTPTTTTPKTTKNNSPPPAPTNNNGGGGTTTTPQPHCDDIVTTTLDPVINQDPTQTTDYVLVTQDNIDRQTQTCYPDVGTDNPTVNVIVAGQPKIETVGTLDPGP